MSEESLEILRSSWDAFNRDGLNGLLRYCDPKVEWTSTATFIEPATYCGHEGVRRYLGIVMGEFEDLRIEPEEVIDAGDDRAVASVRISGRGKQSGAPVELTLISVCSMRDGKVVRIRNYGERAEALEAAGLSE